jgi:hypothetical protein
LLEVPQMTQTGRRFPTECEYRHIGGQPSQAPGMNRVMVCGPKDCSLVGCCASLRMSGTCAGDATTRGRGGQGGVRAVGHSLLVRQIAAEEHSGGVLSGRTSDRSLLDGHAHRMMGGHGA